MRENHCNDSAGNKVKNDAESICLIFAPPTYNNANEITTSKTPLLTFG